MLRAAALFEPSEVAENPAFFSPERIERNQRSKADDLWALGCLMYHGLTGHAPFAGTSKADVRARHTQGPAAPLAVFDVCDDDLANIAESMISIAMEQRVTSATKIRDELSIWLQRRKVKVGPMLDVVRQEPSVRVSLTSVLEEKPLVDRLPSTAELLKRARTSTKLSSVPPPLPPEPRPKSLPPPLPTQVVTESRPPEAARPKSMPPPFPSGGVAIPKAPALPLLPIDPPVAPPTPPPPTAKPAMPAVRVVEPRLEPADLPAPPLPSFAPKLPRKPAAPAAAPAPEPSPRASLEPLAPEPKPVSNRPLANLFDDLDPEPAPAVDRPSAPLAPLLGAAPSVVPAPSTQSTALVADLAPPQKRFPVWIVVAAVAAVIVGGYAVFRFTGGSGGETAGSSSPSAVESATGPGAATPPATSSSVVASASATPTAAPFSVPDPEQCIEALLAPGAVAEGAKPNFTFLCEASDPRKVASQIRSVVIRAARGGVTDAMREWAVMGWYEYAAFASMKGRCCPSAPKIVLPSTSGLCAPMDDALNKISDVSKPGASEADQEAALKGYRESLLCIARGGQHGVFGPYDPPSGGQDTAFMKTFARTRR